MTQDGTGGRRGLLTLRFEELQLSVEELQMRLCEDNLRDIFITGATGVARISRVEGLDIGGVGNRHLGRHGVNRCAEGNRQQRGVNGRSGCAPGRFWKYK